MASVTSARNPLIQDVRQAVRKGTLTESGCCVAEGPHLLAEARRGNCTIEAVLAAEGIAVDPPPGVRVITLPETLFRGISATENSQGIVSLVKTRAWRFDDIFPETPLALILDGVQDPGNAGVMLRTAEAFGASGAIFLKGSVNPFNPKAVRASAGSLFRLPFLTAEEAAVLAEIRTRNLPVYAALPRASRSVSECDFRGPAVFVIGSEGRGVRPSIALASNAVRIPTMGVESLNAATAAAILLYEARRQRTDGRTP
ncbi:MAG TPA: RNA methyltransferase [Bryobacteraceae bacterium]|jgi:TrmH family RNA methyltransferase|nr:RNA methyltransferase [Bryobacteraceae bacterium]